MYSRLLTIFVTVLFALSNGYTLAADRQNLSKDKQTLHRIHNTPTLNEAFRLSPHEALVVSKAKVDKRGFTHIRYRQTFRGVPVWGEEIVISRDRSGKAIHAHGRFIRNLAAQSIDTTPLLAANAALHAMKTRVQNRQNNIAALKFQNESSELVLYIDGDSPTLSYAVSFFADIPDGGSPTRPTFLVDANSGQVLFEYEGLTHVEVGTGPGGNVKTNRYDYGTEFGMLDVDEVGSTCTMNNTNVTTVDLNHGTTGSNSFSYTCPENSHKEINDAYSPLNDAHYFGGVVFNMFNDWLSESPLAAQNMPLTMRVHYSTNYENAFWDGSSMTFGDGYNKFYPLVSLDVTSHEVSHGFTEQHSNLIYSGQSGGINESFSDIAGEAAEFYMNGTADFQVGADIIKGTGALRYMQDPTLDGASIGHASDYFSGMDVHYSSGVYNKAFYLLANTDGWDVQKAFTLFVYANKNIWTASETFDTAYEGLLAAADMLNTPNIPDDPDLYDKTGIIDAFEQVGVPKPPPGAVCTVDEPALTNGVSTSNFSANTGEWNCWRINVATDATNLDVVLRNTAKGRNKSRGDADLYIKHGISPKVDPSVPTGEFDCGSYSSNSDERCTISPPDVVEDGNWYLAVYAYSDVPSVSLKATFDGGESQPPPSGNITLTATVKGGSNKQFVSLNWTGAMTTSVDIYHQEALLIGNTANDGSYKDNAGSRGDEYRICESGTENCSAPVVAN